MIITKLTGGALGNQLFEYANGRSVAHRLNTEFKIDKTACDERNNHAHGRYRLGNFNIHENFATSEDIKSVTVFKENSVFHFVSEILDTPDNTMLEGYWQSEKYFIDIEDIIRREFTLKNPLTETAAAWADKIETAECPVSLHIRRGDYTRPIFRNHSGILSLDYYSACVNELKKQNLPMTIFVFSDDLSWAKDNLKFDVPTEFVKGCEYEYEEMHLMSLCKHNIIANSTFSWWGAWLNRNPDKQVFTPSPWHRDDWGKYMIVPDRWIKIPVDFEKNLRTEFQPLLSIIIYVENNGNPIEMFANSFFIQSFRDYEIIVMDATTDGSIKYFRRFAGNDNVTFIRLNPADSQFAAWNKGIDCACGEFVMFLNSKEFIFPYTTMLIGQVWDYACDKKFMSEGKYLAAKDYDSIAPDIVCSKLRMIEDTNGTLFVNGLPNKKFNIFVDASLKDLNTFVDMNMNNRQKLVLLATEQLNNNLGTKLFKRKFLNEHRIRFDEHQRGGVPN